MTTLKKLKPQAVADAMRKGTATLVDIRGADEYAREHIAGAVSWPLSEAGGFLPQTNTTQTIFHCNSGRQTDEKCDQLIASTTDEAFILEGGINAWKTAGLPVAVNTKVPLPMNRQVQIAAGTLVLIGMALGLFVHSGFLALPIFLGAGLTFAGISGWCGMANLLGFMPWNRRGSTL